MNELAIKCDNPRCRFKNRKNQKIYTYITEGIDCTNARDGTKVIIYHPEGAKNIISRLLDRLALKYLQYCLSSIYVREAKEFFNKFEKI